jgi:pSer/pThr/pTyr-binding forkhead associated (FHA) protein
MPLELKDLSNSKSIMVPEEGVTFGREGGDATVLLRDTGVSKRHARVFGENGAWFLEDLGSSNGTWLQKERIKDATELLPGDIFQLSQAKFEVVQVLGGDDATNMSHGDGEGEPEAEEPEPPPRPASKPPMAAKGASGPKEASISKSGPARPGTQPPKPAQKTAPSKAPTGAAAKSSGGGGGDVAESVCVC